MNKYFFPELSHLVAKHNIETVPPERARRSIASEAIWKKSIEKTERWNADVENKAAEI